MKASTRAKLEEGNQCLSCISLYFFRTISGVSILCSKTVENSLVSKASSTFLSPLNENDSPSILKPTSSATTEIRLILI